MVDKRVIIDRIEKLYALASGGTSPAEASSAISMAEKLARKYGVRDSEINKHRYTKGERAEPKKQQTQQNWSNFWEDIFHGSSGPSYDDYTSWQQRKQRKDYQDFRNEYHHHTFEPKFVRADKIRETEKAVLLNVYLDEKKYPWSTLPRVTVSIWMPKSHITSNVVNVWLLDEELLLRNLKDNIPYLREHHPVFKNRHEDIVFHLKGIV